MGKQLFYKDIFDKLGNKIPVLDEIGCPVNKHVCVEEHIHVYQNDHNYEIDDIIYEDFEEQHFVDFQVYTTEIIVFDTYKILEIRSSILNEMVNVSCDGDEFIQTWSEEGITQIQLNLNENISFIIVECNGTVKNIKI